MDSSPFSKLPLELREQIYAYALCKPDSITINLSAGRPQLQSHISHILSPAQTCSQIRSESLPIFYRGNHFTFHTDHITTSHHGYGLRTSWRACLASWLETIGDDHRRRLRRVDIDIKGWDPHADGLTAEALWASLAPALELFDASTDVALSCYVMYYCHPRQKWMVAPVKISLGDAEMAEEAIRGVFSWGREAEDGERRDGERRDGERRDGERETECLKLAEFIRERQGKMKRRCVEAS